MQIEVTEPALFKPKKLEDDLQDKISDIKYTEKTSVEGFSAVKLRTILKKTKKLTKKLMMMMILMIMMMMMMMKVYDDEEE